MGNITETLVRSLLLSFVASVSATLFFKTVTHGRRFDRSFLKHTVILGYTVGYMVIACTEIPPYFLQPIRFIVMIALVSQIYFRLDVIKTLLLSVIYCGVYWIYAALFAAVLSGMPIVKSRRGADVTEAVLELVYLGLMAGFYYRCRKKSDDFAGVRWGKFGLLSLAGIIVSMAVAMMPGQISAAGYYTRLIILAGFGTAYILGFYYMVSALEKEAQVQRFRLLHERTRSQMNLYQDMKKQYEQQQRYHHDYKNQLGCIQGLIENGQTQEALSYIAGLTGNMRLGVISINTNHSVVNIMLNRKYEEARERGIAMAIAAGDLSGITVGEEDVVTLLGNLIDNAIEACEKLEKNRVIQLKMVVEDSQLVLSIRNPVEEPVRIRSNRIVTSKKDKSRHGIGLWNVDSVIRKNGGTGVLKCEDGWFSFAAMIPMMEEETL